MRKSPQQARRDLGEKGRIQFSRLIRLPPFLPFIEDLAGLGASIRETFWEVLARGTPEERDQISETLSRWHDSLFRASSQLDLPIDVLLMLVAPKNRLWEKPRDELERWFDNWDFSPDAVMLLETPVLGGSPGPLALEDGRFVTLSFRIDTAVPTNDLLPLLNRELVDALARVPRRRQRGPSPRVQRRALAVYDLAVEGETLGQIARTLGLGPENLEYALAVGSRLALGRRERKKRLPFASVDPSRPCEDCPDCAKALASNQLCRKHSAWVDQDTREWLRERLDSALRREDEEEKEDTHDRATVRDPDAWDPSLTRTMERRDARAKLEDDPEALARAWEAAREDPETLQHLRAIVRGHPELERRLSALSRV